MEEKIENDPKQFVYRRSTRESFLYVIVAVALVVKLVETVAVFKMQACEM
jgi:hypothetical protein